MDGKFYSLTDAYRDPAATNPKTNADCYSMDFSDEQHNDSLESTDNIADHVDIFGCIVLFD